ncbi:uncharacterized protein VP01_15114g1, partial [Puccinia sorghi]
MDVIVSDLLGPFDLETTDSEGFILKSKKDVCLTFKRYIKQMERLTGKKLKRHQHLMPYEPEENGAAERLHHTVGKMARTALVASNTSEILGFCLFVGLLYSQSH